MTTSDPTVQGPNYVVAIDGPAASGKSSVSRRVAAALGFQHIDTGAMYRAATWLTLEKGVDPEGRDEVVRALNASELDFRLGDDGRSRLLVDGAEPGTALKSDEVNAAVSLVARIPEVREILVARQRELALRDSVVMEGRDIGSVVFPHTPHKFYLDASPEVRAQRRSREGSAESIEKRDRIDSTRKASPLVVADDAQRIDTSDMTLDEVVVDILARLRARGVRPPSANSHPPGGLYGVGWRAFRAIGRKLYDIRVHGAEHIPARGPMLFASNHVSFLDPPLVGICCPGKIHFVARDSLFRNPLVGWVLRRWQAIPINRDQPELSTLRKVIDLLRRGDRVLLFPEGTRSWDGKLGEAPSGVGMIVARSDAPVLPVRIFGPEKALPRGGHLPHPTEFDIVFGAPFTFSPADREALGTGKELYRGMADEVMRRIGELEIPEPGPPAS